MDNKRRWRYVHFYFDGGAKVSHFINSCNEMDVTAKSVNASAHIFYFPYVNVYDGPIQ